MSEGGDAPLLFEMGQGNCLLAQWNSKGEQPYFVRLWSFAPEQITECVEKIFQTIEAAGINAAKATVGAAFPQIVLVPEELSVDGAALIKALYTADEKDILHHKSEATFYYVFPQHLQHQFLRFFKEPQFIPAPACGILKEAEQDNSIHVFFIDNTIRISVYKAAQLQLVQQYEYNVPLDVVYYLLKICAEFNLTQQETLLSVSGFIAQDSALYNELHQYFLNIRFAHTENISMDGQPVPKYYFTSLYNLAACAL